MNSKIFNFIKNYCIDDETIDDYITLIQETWNTQYGKVVYDNGVLELHTGGWSENEEIISSLMMNKLFWLKYFSTEVRGGHYWFLIKDIFRSPKIKWDKCKLK